MKRTEVLPDTDALLDQIEQDRYRLMTTINSRPGYQRDAEAIDALVQMVMARITDEDLDSQRRVA